MDKPAITKYDIHPLLNKRWSPRSFLEKPVDKAALQRIFEAARWAPSSFNEQPWRFIVGIKGDKTWGKVMEALADFNQKWAKLAPVLVLSVGKTLSSKNNKSNKVFKYDVGQGVAHLTFQATEEGLFVHQMGGFSPEKARELFDIPDGYEPLTVFAIGHKGEPDLLDGDFPEMEKAPRERKEMDELIFEEKFGNPSGLF